MGNDTLWQRLLMAIESRINRQNFEIWFKKVQLIEILEDEIHLEVPTRHFHNWIRDNYQELILSELERLAGRPYRLIFSYVTASAEAPIDATPAQQVSGRAAIEPLERQPTPSFTLNPEKTFDTFVVGSSNQLAHAAARAVADNPAQTYNPLFLFGMVGLGKTHLLNAIGNKILKDRPNARIVYLSSEQFVNELINSIQLDRMNEFRNKYRNTCDALLVDDIQFLAGKIRTQEEFFYTFNALHSSGKQIVVTSDKFPKDIMGLEERLRNRFEWGLIADIQPPDLETTVAILKKKAAMDGIPLPDDVALYIASYNSNNIRELEGILIRLVASSSIYRRPIDMAFAQQELRQLLDNGRPATSIESIQDAVCRYFELKLAELKSHRKNKQLVWPRQIAMYLCRKHTDASFPEIGQKFGGRDHTTVIHAVKKVEELRSSTSEVQNEIKSILRTLGL